MGSDFKLSPTVVMSQESQTESLLTCVCPVRTGQACWPVSVRSELDKLVDLCLSGQNWTSLLTCVCPVRTGQACWPVSVRSELDNLADLCLSGQNWTSLLTYVCPVRTGQACWPVSVRSELDKLADLCLSGQNWTSLLTCVCPIRTEQARILVWCRRFSRYCDWKEDGRIAVQFSTGISLFHALFRPAQQPTLKAI